MVNRFVLKSSEDSVSGYLNDLDDFVDKVPFLEPEVINFHIRENSNDFANWLKHEFSLDINLESVVDKKEAAGILCSKVKSFLQNQRLEILNLFPESMSLIEERIITGEISKQDDSLLNKIVNFFRKII